MARTDLEHFEPPPFPITYHEFRRLVIDQILERLRKEDPRHQFSRYRHRAEQMGRTQFAMRQNHYNLLYREEEREMIPLCVEEGVGLIPWSPLASGRLAGNREAGTVRSKSRNGIGRYNRPADQAVVDAVGAVAKERGESPAQVAIAWLLSKRGLTAPIVGATKLPQLDDPIKAVETSLSAAEVAKLEAPYETQAVIGALGPEAAWARPIRASSELGKNV